MFSNVRVGDRVWSIEYGWGSVDKVYTERLTKESLLLFCVRFSATCKIVYTETGRTFRLDICCDQSVQQQQTLFWDEIKFTIPARPFHLTDEYNKLTKVKHNRYSDNVYVLKYFRDTDGKMHWVDVKADYCLGMIGFVGNSELHEFVKKLNEYKVSILYMQEVIEGKRLVVNI